MDAGRTQDEHGVQVRDEAQQQQRRHIDMRNRHALMRMSEEAGKG